jgi:acetyl-CoA carboxylase biotin carboxylase subunit
MIKKVLIANRGEIACRIIKSCREMGIETVAVYSDADKNAVHAKSADEAVHIGPAPANESYLNFEKIINAAKSTGCDAIHPGYGFLSENHEFNTAVVNSGLIFIGPNPGAMELLGSKVASRETMISAGVPVVPGMKTSSPDIEIFEKTAGEIGFPVLIKASAGGGGKGMRVVREQGKLREAVDSAMREAGSAFGNSDVFLEKYVESPRHIEFQVAADRHGNYVHLFERECSIQRRHQKIIEETPSVALSPDLLEEMGLAAVNAVRAAGYDNIGTVEFLLDKDGNYYFLEVNARIQVEHPVTEETTGIDLVKLQIQIANGGKLPFTQDEITRQGHAIECRIYAEDAEKNFIPSSGKIHYLKEPKGPGIRYDSGIEQGSEVSVFYDPVLAKLIVKGADREEARKKMIMALKENVILGVKTSTEFMVNCLEHPEFIEGRTFTDFIDNHFDELNKKDLSNIEIALGAAVKQDDSKKQYRQENFEDSGNNSPWDTLGSWKILSREA